MSQSVLETLQSIIGFLQQAKDRWANRLRLKGRRYSQKQEATASLSTFNFREEAGLVHNFTYGYVK